MDSGQSSTLIFNNSVISCSLSVGAAKAENVMIQNLTKVYWATQTIAIVSSIAVSVVFWVGVYNPGKMN